MVCRERERRLPMRNNHNEQMRPVKDEVVEGCYCILRVNGRSSLEHCIGVQTNPIFNHATSVDVFQKRPNFC